MHRYSSFLSPFTRMHIKELTFAVKTGLPVLFILPWTVVRALYEDTL